MKVCDLVKILDLTVFCGEKGLDTEITGGYTSDLLSDVMGHIEENMLWITMQTHQNLLAVATLKDVAAVLIVNGSSPDTETLQKGREEAVPLLGTTLSAFEASGRIYQLLQNGNE
ncbi:DRTGG domain-containing protein [uncultured Parabacteroides sp.]|uniref:DRTGG domain-containing protein n=1 Tax=uncultured Parabacteroides sp. TaxID=512312 RepID=UPI0026046B9E|nr:DRTGG domain-containing protein [uncultured Parabacteroides sp.]